MKKLLSILGAVSLTATGASNVIACGEVKSEEKQPDKLVQSEKTKPTIIDTQTNLTEGKNKLEQDLTAKQSEINSLTGDIKNETELKMKYFNELNNKIKKNRTELVKKINILENKNKDLEQQQTSIKQEIEQLQQEIQQLDNQVGKSGSEAMEFALQKRLKIAINDKNNEILEQIIKQIEENKIEIQQLETQKASEKFNVSQFNSIISPTKIIVSSTQKEGNKIYAVEKDINKIVLNQLQEKINSNLRDYDFVIEFESKYINHNGMIAIELSHPKTIKIKIHGIHNSIGETS